MGTVKLGQFYRNVHGDHLYQVSAITEYDDGTKAVTVRQMHLAPTKTESMEAFANKVRPGFLEEVSFG